MRALRARVRTVHDDDGFGLPELLVSMFLLAIVSTLVVTLVSSFTRTFTRERSAVESTNTAAVGMNELTRVIRSGTEIRVSGSPFNRPVLIEAMDEGITLYAFLDTDSVNPRPVRVRFRIDATRVLHEDRWYADAASAPYWTFGADGRDPDSSRPVARRIVPRGPDETAMFTYRTSEVCPEGGDPDCNVLVPPAGGTLTEDSRRQIALVEIRLTVQADESQRAEPVTIRNQVGLPNLGIDRLGASR